MLSALPQAIISLQDGSGKEVGRRTFTLTVTNMDSQLQNIIEFIKKNASLLIKPTRLSHKNESQVSFDSFDLKQTKSSTPLLPPRPINGSDELFISDESRPSLEQPDSLEIVEKRKSTDDMDTQPPLLYMDQPLEEVSTDEDDGPQLCSESSCGTILNSLNIDVGGKAIGGILQCTPTEKFDPDPEIFKDLKFVFSCEVDNSGTSMVGLHKKHYEERLKGGGGQVYDSIPRGDVKNTIMISDEHCQTRNYYLALLLGIPCISYEWITDCIDNQRTYGECRIDKIQRTLYLHRGRDILTNEIVRQDKDIKDVLKPFKRQIVYLQGTREFKDTWSELVEAGGGEAIKRWFRNTSTLSYPTIVASDGSSAPSKTTVKFNVPIVSKDWLKQCVIRGELADPEPFKVIFI